MPGALLLIDANRSVLNFAARPDAGSFDLPDLPANSPETVGATIEFFDTAVPGAGANILRAEGDGWRPLVSGWSYRNSGQPCRVRLKSTRISAMCGRFWPTLAPPVSGDVQVVMTIGSKRYCATFGGTTRVSRPRVLSRKGAPAGPCLPLPCGRFVTSWGSSGTGDRQFNYADSIAVDSAGHVFVGELLNRRIQKFDANGVFSHEVGQSGLRQRPVRLSRRPRRRCERERLRRRSREPPRAEVRQQRHVPHEVGRPGRR